jgi:hypothetical protein
LMSEFTLAGSWMHGMNRSESRNVVFRCYSGGLGKELARYDDFRSYVGVNPRIRVGIRVVRLFWDATTDNGEETEW